MNLTIDGNLEIWWNGFLAIFNIYLRTNNQKWHVLLRSQWNLIKQKKSKFYLKTRKTNLPLLAIILLSKIKGTLWFKSSEYKKKRHLVKLPNGNYVVELKLLGHI